MRVSIVDELGHVVPYADSEINFAVDGAGSSLGVGNGNPSSHESDQANSRRAFNGHALALLQAGKTAGSLKLKASSPGLLSDALLIQVCPEKEMRYV
ncbi:hypothetical protein EHS13_02750 [Paenibacillus psychroresistens]|uniref:Glycoside hydrolase family 2 domain-containing protein n=1 Tax=Paenibacillus psychroresistens TaxID=1778678 RepID=A0A6B8REK4_9BACL|nr:hypothetical protein [Paenibacillus psychroresistens]QGQ93902.1 hypothetical protein EHS13_02750 [Paenibacillus psychroresistens]